jgi:hypothetical protein
MTVFLSHKQEDADLAKACSLRLQLNRVPVYLDVLDETIGDAEDITAHFLGKIRQCSHLIAVVTNKTKGSWWVPFEIGAASSLEKRICSVVRGIVEQPDFLSKWPRLDASSSKDWEEFATLYRQDATSGIKTLDSVQASVKTAAQFHRSLKRALGQ